MIFKDLIIPQWWLDWIIPLTSLVMALQALEMLIGQINSPTTVSHEASGTTRLTRPNASQRRASSRSDRNINSRARAVPA